MKIPWGKRAKQPDSPFPDDPVANPRLELNFYSRLQLQINNKDKFLKAFVF